MIYTNDMSFIIAHVFHVVFHGAGRSAKPNSWRSPQFLGSPDELWYSIRTEVPAAPEPLCSLWYIYQK